MQVRVCFGNLGGKLRAMSAPLSSDRPGRSEMSHGTSRYGHPDSDYQSARALPWEVAGRVGGSKRGGFTGEMSLMAQKRTDVTRSDEVIEEMLYVRGNPDMYGPDQPIVQEKVQRAPSKYKQPVIRTSVDRQE